MFYSHEVLTSRKYGVATVWLVATLGSKSNLKKINRKAILDVDIPRACQTITEPEAPMALRLQSNLLYGISRVYSQQCVYVLVDAQTAQSNMRALLRAAGNQELDPNVGKTRPDQLVVPDDPAFLPDFFLSSLDLDLSLLENSTQGSSARNSILSTQSQLSSKSSNGGDGSLFGLVIPRSDSGNAGDFGSFLLPESDGGSRRKYRDEPLATLDDEQGFYPDVDFNFDAEGNMIDLGAMPSQPVAGSEVGGARVRSDSATSANVRQEHQEGLLTVQRAIDDGMDLDLDQHVFTGDNYNLALPEAEPFPERREPADKARSSASTTEEELSSDSAEAAQIRRPRGRRLLPVDSAQEMRNADINAWNTDYLSNMAEVAYRKMQHKMPSQARKNAASLVFGTGIGCIGTMSAGYEPLSALNMFTGDNLRDALLGIQSNVAGQKRGHSDNEDSGFDSEGRRVRQRSDDGEQVGRGDDMGLDEDNEGPIYFDDSEVGRDAVLLLEDHSASMPWNISASLHGSRQGSVTQVRGLNSSLGGFPTSAGAPSSLPPLPIGMRSSIDRRTSRLTSASPLHGRGLEPRGSPERSAHDDGDKTGSHGFSDDTAFDDFQLYGPAAGVNTQTAGQSRWLEATLDQESTNFLEFVKTELAREVEDHEDEIAADGTAQKRTIQFANLLPPAQHSKIVAAQAFHHILTLATKRLLNLEQRMDLQQPYAPIYLEIAGGI